MIPLWLALGGCGTPISNAAFYADEGFLAALPDEALLAAPAAVVDAITGDEALLAEAQAQAATIGARMGPLGELGASIAATEPTDRHDTYRVWDGVPATVHEGDTRHDVWVRAEVVHPRDDLPMDWTLDIGATRVGPWVRVAAGSHGTAGGTLTWDVEAGGALLGLDGEEGVYVVTYGRSDAPRAVEITQAREVVGPDLLPVIWGLYGEDALSWVGELAVTDDGLGWPGGAVVRQTATGGRAEGFVVRDGDEIAFGRCWGPTGDRVWAGGDPGAAQTGSEGACAVGPLLE